MLAILLVDLIISTFFFVPLPTLSYLKLVTLRTYPPKFGMVTIYMD